MYRSVASPNRGFIAQLQIYENDLRDFYGDLCSNEEEVVWIHCSIVYQRNLGVGTCDSRLLSNARSLQNSNRQSWG